jgi:CRISPR-associated endonuclease/helicase Cas3
LSPPGSLEALPLPIGALRRWLDPKDKRAISLSDAGNPLEEESQDWRMEAPPTVFVWRGEESERRSLRDLKPGDTVVLAATRGGLRRGNFDPASREPVTDLGDAVQWAQRQRPTLRCHPALLAQYGLPAAPESPSEETEELFEEALRAFLSADPPAQPKWLAPVWKSLKAKRRVVTGPPGAPITLLGRARRGEESSGEDTSAHTGVAVPLARHLRGVGDWAADFAAAAGLSAARVDDLREAGRQHDIGKADPRFQRWLHGGSEVRAALSPHPLAKSAIPASDRAAREAARRRSGYPKGARHELQSLALLQGDAAWLDELAARGGDAELVLFLVASHHGHCRPFAPVVLDPLPVTVQFEGRAASSDHGLACLDSGVSSRFWRLVERYGPHGLAALEALLRLADHHRSALEQKEGLYD